MKTRLAASFPILLPLFALLLIQPLAARAVTVSTAQELLQAVDRANQGGDTEILLENGTYRLDRMLWVEADNLRVRGLSGDRDSVIITGQGMAGGVTHIFNVAGSNFQVSDVTLRDVSQHAIQTQPSADAPQMRNLHILDTGEQMVKIAWDEGSPSATTDNGLLEHCLLEYSAGIGPQYYIGGIDCHAGKNWVVRGNVFRYIRSPEADLAEHAIHFWSWAENTLVENNLILDCDRGIGFGLGDRGHRGGMIRNNMIHHRDRGDRADVSISLESAPGAQVCNNTIIHEHPYPNAIEYRFGQTRNVLIANNLTNAAITARDGASADLRNNVASARPDWFADQAGGNLHLSGPVPEVVDKAMPIPGLDSDFDGQPRPNGPAPDIGADEI